MTLELAVADEKGCPIRLDNVVIYFTAKQNFDEIQPIFQKISTDPTQIEVIDEYAGIARIYLMPADTINLELRDYIFDVWLVFNSTGKRYPIVGPATFTLMPSVTVLSL
jgi:hypothetical protein